MEKKSADTGDGPSSLTPRLKRAQPRQCRNRHFSHAIIVRMSASDTWAQPVKIRPSVHRRMSRPVTPIRLTSLCVNEQILRPSNIIFTLHYGLSGDVRSCVPTRTVNRPQASLRQDPLSALRGCPRVTAPCVSGCWWIQSRRRRADIPSGAPLECPDEPRSD
jgi:hypothetical protein